MIYHDLIYYNILHYLIGKGMEGLGSRAGELIGGLIFLATSYGRAPKPPSPNMYVYIYIYICIHNT